MATSRIDDLSDWIAALGRPSTLTELGALAGCAVLAWWLARLVRGSLAASEPSPVWFGRGIVDGVLFPLVLLCLAYAARTVLANWTPTVVFRIAIPVLVALLVIRVVAKVLQLAFRETPIVRVLERSISWLAWIARSQREGFTEFAE